MTQQKIGFWITTSLVMGNMIGAGIFFLPATLGKYGSISLLGWLVSALGALMLAFVFIALARQYPGVAGGPYVYSRLGFGNTVGFLMGWSYLVSVWLGLASVVSAFVGYLGVFIPSVNTSTLWAFAAGAAVTVFLSGVNIRGVRAGGTTQLITTVLKITPLVAIIVGGLMNLEPDNFRPFNATGEAALGVVAVTGMLTFFSFLGVEAAAIPAGDIRNPRRTIPLATLTGTLTTTAIYVLATIALIGMLSVTDLGNSAAPFADAAERLWSGNAPYLIAAGILVSTFGALNGWILVAGQITMAIARDGALPQAMARLGPGGSPGVSIVVTCIVTIALLGMNFADGLAEAFEFLVTVSVGSALLPYIACAGAAAMGCLADPEQSGMKKTAISGASAASAMFCLWIMTSMRPNELLWSLAITVSGLPLFWMSRHRRRPP